jgi:hypothetical protein
MKKLFIVIAVLALVVALGSPAGAQNKMALNIGLNVEFPMGTFGDVQGVGFGGTVQGEYVFMPQFVGTAKLGYIVWGGKDITQEGVTISGGSYKGVPFLVGGKYYFMPPKTGAINWYGQAEIGLFFGSYTIAAQNVTVPGFGTVVATPEASASSTDFTFVPSVGAEIPMGKGAIDASVHYFLIASSGSAGSIGIRAGYKFPI